ncbi:MAG TPA: metallophosphoesterase [Rhodoblastus sp.]|nr:metallophosphoesterase [Rhodoblastus sp.]
MIGTNTIALITDTHLARDGRAVRANLEAIRAWIAGLGAEATLHLGDATADGARRLDDFAAAAEAFADWPTPLHVTPGNHDVGDNRDAARSPQEPPVDHVRLEQYRSAFGADHWRLALSSGWTLLGLNAMALGWPTEEARQDAWLDEALSRAAGGPVALFLHKPLFRDSPADALHHPRYVPVEARNRLLARLKARLAPGDLRLIVSGHVHQFRRLVVDGVEHVWAPSSAFVFPADWQETIGEKIVGALQISFGRDVYDLALVRPPGIRQYSLLDQTDIYPQLLARAARERRNA